MRWRSNARGWLCLYFFGAMESQELQRIRMLQNRMRRPSRVGPQVSEESLKSIKSTDSKKIMPQLHKLVEEAHEDSPLHSNIRLSDEELKFNRKITDYFHLRPGLPAPPPPPLSPLLRPPLSQPTAASAPRSPLSPEDSKGAGEEPLREEVRVLREKLRERDEQAARFRAEIVEATVRLHRAKRNELRLRVSNNKIRLGEYLSDKKGKEQWIDGTEFRELREKLEGIQKEKDALDRSKRQARKGKEGEESEEWRVALASQAFFLSREESHCQEALRRLEEEKAMHIKEYRLLYEEQHSRYGRLEAGGSGVWPRIRKYQLLSLLGKGGFSEVYKGFDCEELRDVAVKLHEFHSNWNSSAKENYVKHALRENCVHKMLAHPNIVQLYDTVEIDASSFCTVMEFCEGPDLSHYLKKHKRIPEKEARLILRQVMSAIRYLHELPDKVIHYDLKPQNILFHKGRVKITDFGLCKTTKDDYLELTSQGVGTYWYLPPECFVSDQKAVISPKVDVWSVGVIYYEMIFGEKPFGNQMSQMRILNEGIMLKASVVNFPNTQKGLISNESKDFIRDCLAYNVDQRIDIKTALNHKMFDKK